MDTPVSTKPDTPAALAPFAILWAFALFFHQVAYGFLSVSWVDQALAALALITIALPRSVRILWVLCAFHVVVVVRQLPDASNHWFFAGIVSFGLCVGMFRSIWLAGRGTGASDDPFQRVVPAAQLSLLILYAGSGIHKLNYDFVDNSTSCATSMARTLLYFVDAQTIPMWFDHTVVLLTAMTELGLPILLLVPRWRAAGVLLALGFHVLTALAGYPRFSAICGALITLFIPSSAWSRLVPPFRAALGEFTRVAGAGGLLLSALLIKSTPSKSPLLIAYLLLTALVGVVVVRQWANSDRGSQVAFTLRGSRLALLAPALMLVVIAAPYLGLSTHRSMSMYSNLRTEAPQSNHLLFDARWQPFGFQRDLVIVHATSAHNLQPVVDQDHVLPYVEFRARLSDALRSADSTRVFVTFSRGGEQYRVPDVARDSMLRLPVTAWHRRFFRFRSVERAAPRACTI